MFVLGLILGYIICNYQDTILKVIGIGGKDNDSSL